MSERHVPQDRDTKHDPEDDDEELVNEREGHARRCTHANSTMLIYLSMLPHTITRSLHALVCVTASCISDEMKPAKENTPRLNRSGATLL